MFVCSSRIPPISDEINLSFCFVSYYFFFPKFYIKPKASLYSLYSYLSVRQTASFIFSEVQIENIVQALTVIWQCMWRNHTNISNKPVAPALGCQVLQSVVRTDLTNCTAFYPKKCNLAFCVTCMVWVENVKYASLVLFWTLQHSWIYHLISCLQQYFTH